MKVLSLFDGISCGRVALERAGVPVEVYYASEIDKYAMQVSAKNYPDIIQIGDCTQVDFTKYIGKVDLIIGGSPCQGFSFAGKQLNFSDPRSKLFFEFVRAVKTIKPKYFLLENVKMKQEFQDVISEQLGVQPIEINSALVSAQNRKRLYWTNIPNVSQPADRGVLLKDIILTDVDEKYFLTAKNLAHVQRQFGSKAQNLSGKDKANTITAAMGMGGGNIPYIRAKFSTLNPPKAQTMLARQYANYYGTYLGDGESIRRLTPIECERLQTLPDNYTAGVSDSQRYKMLGNGWTVDVIAHLLKGLK